jgi:hypothetical protein
MNLAHTLAHTWTIVSIMDARLLASSLTAYSVSTLCIDVIDLSVLDLRYHATRFLLSFRKDRAPPSLVRLPALGHWQSIGSGYGQISSQLSV